MLAAKDASPKVIVEYNQQDTTRRARDFYNAVSPFFDNSSNAPLSKALARVTELGLQLGLQPKKSQAKKKKEGRICWRRAKEKVEAQWKKTEIVRHIPFTTGGVSSPYVE